jgi:hypothetical protein
MGLPSVLTLLVFTAGLEVACSSAPEAAKSSASKLVDGSGATTQTDGTGDGSDGTWPDDYTFDGSEDEVVDGTDAPEIDAGGETPGGCVAQYKDCGSASFWSFMRWPPVACNDSYDQAMQRAVADANAWSQACQDSVSTQCEGGTFTAKHPAGWDQTGGYGAISSCPYMVPYVSSATYTLNKLDTQCVCP